MMIQSEETIETQVPLAALRAAILDFDCYADFLPEVDVSKVLERKADFTQVHFESSIGRKIQYALEFHHAEEGKITWRMLRGQVLKRNSGYWELVPRGENGTKVKYCLELEVGFPVPEFLVRQFVEANLRKTVDRFIAQAQKKMP